ncbi:hypothetical protein MD273_15115 [Marinobacter pelagius]|uniref:hypothetical protein n=1 Tax=Marinobacter sp. C7 TaxID=2951363 RepID=UPI001EF093F2|nr:hypothetical protein [Marinobacter sp. C7]MCG7201061.1 hypothetical protein [Marinobacter sp. C7]
MEQDTESRQEGAWAQPYSLVSGDTRYHELGHVQLWVTLLDLEWQVRVRNLEARGDPSSWIAETSHVLPSPDVPLQRFVRADRNDGTLTLIPAMADLPTVIRPFQPLTIPAGARCVIYVGTTVWMKICAGGAEGSVLTEVPLSTPLLTWVGGNTMEGELCYSSSSFARLVLEAVPKRPWRAVTPVTIINGRSEPLLLERFNLPTPMLSLYRNEKGQLWTPGVTVECETDMTSAILRVEQGLHPAAGDCQKVGNAREVASRGRLVRAFDRMFG